MAKLREIFSRERNLGDTASMYDLIRRETTEGGDVVGS